MTWEIPLSLGGPVLHWELLRATRRLWPHLLRYCYAGWLLLQFIILISGFMATLRASEMEDFDPLLRVVSEETRGAKFIRFSQDYVSLFLHQQLIFLVLVTPAVVAGALGHEKERGTLEGLLGTELKPSEIVYGKLLGRLAVLGQLFLIGLPLYMLMGSFSGLALGRLFLGLLQAAALALAMAGATMLSSVWTRQTRDAILACYAMVTLTFLGILTMLGDLPLPTVLNPIEVLQREFSPPYQGVGTSTVVLHLAVWSLSGAACVALASLRLRRACLLQLEGVGKKPLRLMWLLRPGIRGNPVRWRETYVIGLAPLPWLRMVPKWMAMVGVFSFSVILVLSALSSLVGPNLFHYLWHAEFSTLRGLFPLVERSRVFQEITVMGVVLLILGPLVVGVRCAGSIGVEKRRKTWQDLVVTPLTAEEIIQGKMWGVLAAVVPYLVMYAMPMVAFSALAGVGGVLLAIGFLGGAVVAMFLAAALGSTAAEREMGR
jgi:ABC-type transport system involved in multi-copper enzyme maturation permease subunit